jgi:hypothetical protein
MELNPLDITGPEEVEIMIKEDGKVLWVNVGGLCVLRICKIGKLTLEDKRKKNGRKQNR